MPQGFAKFRLRGQTLELSIIPSFSVVARKEPRTKYFLMRDFVHLFGVRSEFPAGGLVASVPLAPILVAFGVRSGDGLPGVLSEVFPASEPEVPG